MNGKSGIELIAEERQRQQKEEGWSDDHDDGHVKGEMAGAAACYALQACGFSRPDHIKGDHPEASQDVRIWPWGESWWKPSTDPIRDLQKAGALIAAEIDRIQRQRSGDSNEETS